MSLSYAGVTLPAITREVAAQIESRLCLSSLYPWDQVIGTVGQAGYGLAARSWAEEPIRLGVLSWPSEASRWAKGFYLATDTQLAAIREVVQYGDSYLAAPLVLGDGIHAVTASMYMLAPRPLMVNADGEGLWLLPLVDQRYFWWKLKGSFALGGALWPTVYSTLMQLLPGSPTLTADAINAAYQAAPSDLSATDVHIPPYLDWVARSVGQQVVCSLEGQVYAYGTASSAALNAANWSQLLSVFGGSTMQLGLGYDTPSVLPGQVQVVFPSVQGGSLVSAMQTVTVAFSSTGVLPGAVTGTYTQTLTHPFQAVLDSNSNWTNEATCQSLALQYATDYYNYALADNNAAFAGIVPWEPTGFDDYIEYVYRRDMVCTRVFRRTWEDGPHAEAGVSGTLGVPGSGGGGGTVIYNNYNFTYYGGNITYNTVNVTSNYPTYTITNGTYYDTGSTYNETNVLRNWDNETILVNKNSEMDIASGERFLITGSGPFELDTGVFLEADGPVLMSGPFDLAIPSAALVAGQLPNPNVPIAKLKAGNLQGIAAPAPLPAFPAKPAPGQQLTFFNVDTSNVQIPNMAGNPAASGILTPTGQTFPVPPNGVFTLIYDPGLPGWRMASCSSSPTLVDDTDETPGFLSTKIVAGTGISVTPVGVPTDSLEISLSGGSTGSGEFTVADYTAGAYPGTAITTTIAFLTTDGGSSGGLGLPSTAGAMVVVCNNTNMTQALWPPSGGQIIGTSGAGYSINLYPSAVAVCTSDPTGLKWGVNAPGVYGPSSGIPGSGIFTVATLTATGNTQTTAAPITTTIVFVNTTNTSGTPPQGVILPDMAGALIVVCVPQGNQSVNVYPPVGGEIISVGTANSAVGIASGQSFTFASDPSGLLWGIG